MSKYVHITSCPLPAAIRATAPGELTLDDLNILMASSLINGIAAEYFGIYEIAIQDNELIKIRREKEGDATFVIKRFFETQTQAENFSDVWAVVSAEYFALYPDVVAEYSTTVEMISDEDYALVIGNVDLSTLVLE